MTGLLATIVAAGAVAAVPVEKEGTWIEVRSPAFVVLTDAGISAARRTIARFEKVRAAFAAVMPEARDSGEREMLVIAARDETSLRSLVPQWWETRRGGRPSTVHLSGHDQVFVLVRADLGEDDDEVYHAAYWGYASHLLTLNIPRLPLWASRGLAEFYAHTTVQKDRVLVGRVAASHVRTLREGGLLPLTVLWTVDRQSPEYVDRARLRRFDAQSWALVHYLMLGDAGEHRPSLARFLALAGEGREAGDAARRTLGDPAALGDALASYVRKRAFDMETIETGAQREVRICSERPLSATEALTMRAAVHLAGGLHGDAHACVDEALRLDPELAWAHEIRAALAWEEDDPLVAREAVEKALVLDPNRPLAARIRERVSGPPTVKGAETLCRAGDLDACATLGGWLIDGSGTVADPSRGVELIDQACEGGVVEACHQLAWRHRNGDGVEASPGRALAYLEKACRVGDGRACLAAALDHQEARGVPTNAAAAARMLESACTHGERAGCVALAWALQNGEGVRRDLARAAALYEDECLAGNGEACTRLGLLYVARNGLPTDRHRAEGLLARGCTLGDQLGCSNLEVVRSMSTPETRAGP